ncbi:MAG: hypothetical protein WC551_02740 [Patescibacteria group bacterium]
MKNISVGSKFRLLGEVWTVGITAVEGQILAETKPGKDESEVIYLDLSKADKLEWLDEEKPNLGEPNRVELWHETHTKNKAKLKSEIIRETLGLMAEAWEQRDTDTGVWLRRKIKEMEHRDEKKHEYPDSIG